METPVRGPLTSRREAGRIAGSLLPAIFVLLAWGWGVEAQEKSPEDPNELSWRRYDVQPEDPNDPNKVLEAKWNAALGVLQAKDLDQKVKERIIDKIVSPIFDFPLMGQLALGRTYWPKLNAEQRERFVRLFVARLKALYLEKTTLYKNETASFKPAISRKHIVHIPVVLISGDREIAMLYKLHSIDEQSRDKADVRWKIYDLEIEGVSILLTYRSQFDDILRRGTVDDLLSHLEKPPSQ